MQICSDRFCRIPHGYPQSGSMTNPVGIVDLHHPPILVPCDVEADPVILKDAGVSIIRFHLRRGW